jgi:prolyl-tRNA editing enzyme YbaK/EbsC (Cys-tRNA(Pro) deacylase)
VRVGQELQESTERFVDAAVATGIAAAPIRFPEGTKTSVDAANAIGCDLGAIAKSLVFLVDEQPVLVICSGDRRVDEHKLAALFGGSKAKAAPLSRVREISGYAGGGTPAVGHTTPMPAVVDPSLGRYRWVWSAGGTPETVYPVALERLVAATGAQIASVSMEV